MQPAVSVSRNESSRQESESRVTNLVPNTTAAVVTNDPITINKDENLPTRVSVTSDSIMPAPSKVPKRPNNMPSLINWMTDSSNLKQPRSIMA